MLLLVAATWKTHAAADELIIAAAEAITYTRLGENM
jgi:hypothetical protein